MECPACRYHNPEEMQFCGKCGEKLSGNCPKCSFQNPPDFVYCGKCGFALKGPAELSFIDHTKPKSYTPKFLADKILTSRSSIEGERKLVTVLFADVANYTSIAEKLDPEEVHKIMDGCFRILIDEIHKYEGTINQFTGDGVMALFGAPLSHEDHAHRACYAALSIQRALEPYSKKVKQDYCWDFKMRIGMNSGTVVVASIGDDLRMDYTAVGDTTNLAARIESKAEPGRILLSRATYKLVKDFFEFSQLIKVEVKGKDQPQEAYELTKTGKIETRIKASVAKGLTKFVGRKNSMVALKEPYERVISGSGQVVGVVGEAGVGKSRLVLEFINQLPREEFTFIEGRCLQYGSGMVYLPILDIVRSYFEIKEGDREFIIKKKLDEKIRQLDERLLRTVPPFQELLSIEVDDEKYLQLDPSQRKIRVFEAVRDLLIRESEKTLLVLAIEDLHWIDNISEECISYLIEWLPNTRILLVLLYRPEYIHQWGSKSYYTKVGLTQLGKVSSSQLVQRILEGGEVLPDLKELILNRAGGNPLYIEELTHNLLENGLIDYKDNQYVLIHNETKIFVPDTIQGIIAARIDRVEEDIKQVMQVASVIGREFAFRILQSVMGMQEKLKSHLLNLQKLEFISEKKLFPELEYIFKHALTQEVAYNSLLQNMRETIHENIGLAIESIYHERLEEYYELLAYHYSLSKNTEKAVIYFYLANQKTSMTNAPERAKKYFDDAMKLLDKLPITEENKRLRISLLINQRLVMFLLLNYPEYHDQLTRFEHMAVKLEDEGLLGAFYGRLATCEWGLGNFDRAIRLNTKAVELCEAARDFEETAYAYAQLQWAHQYKGNFNQVLFLKERALKILKNQFNLHSYSWAMMASACAYTNLGHWHEAESECQKLLKVAKEFSDDSVTSFAALILSHTYSYKMDSDKAIEYGELAVKKAITPGDKMHAEAMLAWALCKFGEKQKGIALLADIVSLLRAVGFFPGEFLAVNLGEGYFLSGEFDKATHSLEEFIAIAEGCGMKYEIGRASRILGEIALTVEPTQAPTHFDKSISIFKEINSKNELALSYAGYGLYHKNTGDIGKAREYLTQALELLERLCTLIYPEKIKKELAELVEL